MASYEVVNDVVTKFEFKLADWGSAGRNAAFFGGTPGYASKEMFSPADKDSFSIGRLALDMFIDKKGILAELVSFKRFLYSLKLTISFSSD